MLKLIVDRKGSKEVIGFGNEDSGRNLPYAVFVDNIGLNGLLLLEDQSEREFFITAAPVALDQSRVFHLKTGAGGGQTSGPVVVRVRSTP
ncbi:MAG: hypothetical protein R3B90_00450 [Planctomycetaceae bacterium]